MKTNNLKYLNLFTRNFIYNETWTLYWERSQIPLRFLNNKSVQNIEKTSDTNHSSSANWKPKQFITIRCNPRKKKLQTCPSFQRIFFFFVILQKGRNKMKNPDTKNREKNWNELKNFLFRLLVVLRSFSFYSVWVNLINIFQDFNWICLENRLFAKFFNLEFFSTWSWRFGSDE